MRKVSQTILSIMLLHLDQYKIAYDRNIKSTILSIITQVFRVHETSLEEFHAGTEIPTLHKFPVSS